MGRIIREFEDGSFLEYDKGAFDDWCVYLTRPEVSRCAPRDSQYFQRMVGYADEFGAEQLYGDFCHIYDLTSKTLDASVFDEIDKQCVRYGDKSIDVAIDLSILYMGMIAEENKAGTRLGKRVKRLGMHQVLMEGLSPNYAANFSKGRKWMEIGAECARRGF